MASNTPHRTQNGRRRPKPAPAAGIREIAAALRISIGTVDRALHDRAGISPATRARVLKMAKRIGYRPNMAARYLSSRKELRIGVALPREIASFWDLVRGGLHEASRPFESTGVRIVDHPYARLGEGEVEAIQDCLDDDIHGLVIAPGRPDRLKPLIARAKARGVEVVCVNTDAPGTKRLATVAVDPVINGSFVAELMGHFVRRNGALVVVTGLLATIDHAKKLEGFRQTIGTLWPALTVGGVVEAHDDEHEAYLKCRDMLAEQPEVVGVYVSTANSLPVLRAIDDEGLTGKVTVITTDLFLSLVPLIESGRVAATVFQRPRTQGRLAFETLYRFLVEGLTPLPFITLSPHIVMKSNLELFRGRIGSATKLEFTRAPEGEVWGARVR